MQYRIEYLLLVEDSEATIHYNKRLIERNHFARHIQLARNGEEALHYLSSVDSSCFPELILLDLNMPRLGGFGFLQKFQEDVSEELKKRCSIVLLSTSLLESDMERAKAYGSQILLANKPLTKELLERITGEFFREEGR